MVDENEVEGTARNLGGKIQDAVGGFTGDSETQAEGKINQAAGQAQKAIGSLAEDLRDNVADQPLTALAIVGAIGLALGFLLRR